MILYRIHNFFTMTHLIHEYLPAEFVNLLTALSSKKTQENSGDTAGKMPTYLPYLRNICSIHPRYSSRSTSGDCISFFVTNGPRDLPRAIKATSCSRTLLRACTHRMRFRIIAGWIKRDSFRREIERVLS